ncbi:MAG: hypothetical protein VW262_06300 [Flavobacteriaceae bacterium]
MRLQLLIIFCFFLFGCNYKDSISLNGTWDNGNDEFYIFNKNKSFLIVKNNSSPTIYKGKWILKNNKKDTVNLILNINSIKTCNYSERKINNIKSLKLIISQKEEITVLNEDFKKLKKI